MRLDGALVLDSYAEAFPGLFCRLLVTARDERRLASAVASATALPSTVFGEAEGGVERWLGRGETPDGRVGAIIQLWVSKTGEGARLLEREAAKRIRQGILVVPTTRVFNALDSESSFDAMERIGHCGDGYESVERRFGREVINIPIMMGEFLIERWLGYAEGVMGGNVWFLCRDLESALRVGERAVEAVLGVPYAITPFGVCSAGSKVETRFPHIGPTTNHPFCPALRGRIRDSKVPEGVGSIPEIVINGSSLAVVKEAMREAMLSAKGENGVLYISAGNFGGKLGKYKIFLRDLI